MSGKTFGDGSLYCPICRGYVAKLTPELFKKVIDCSRCKTKFQFVATSVKDWERANSSKKGLSFGMGISAVVDKEDDIKRVKSYSKDVGN